MTIFDSSSIIEIIDLNEKIKYAFNISILFLIKKNNFQIIIK